MSAEKPSLGCIKLCITDNATLTKLRSFFSSSARLIPCYRSALGINRSLDLAVGGSQMLVVTSFERHYGSLATTCGALVLSSSWLLTVWICEACALRA
jgi:hypothetical protein